MVVAAAGCAGGSGYEEVIDSSLQAIQSGDAEKLVSLFDMDSYDEYIEAAKSVMAKNVPAENQMEEYEPLDEARDTLVEQESFLKLYDDLQYEFGKDFTAEKGNVYLDDENSLADIEKFQRLRKLENKDETITETEFINDFVDGLADIKIVDTTVTIRSKDGEAKTRMDVHFVLYQRNNKWYLDSANVQDIVTPGILSQVYNALSSRAEGSYPAEEAASTEEPVMF